MNLDATVQLLAKVAPLTRLEREALRLIAFSADLRRLRVGDVLFRKGERSHGAALVVSGAIALDAGDDGSPAGEIVRPGALIGALALIAPTDHAAQAIAREDSAVLVISRVLFRRVLEEYPHSAALIHADYAQNLQDMRAALARVATRLDRAG